MDKISSIMDKIAIRADDQSEHSERNADARPEKIHFKE
jgi:hypothetical protein